LILIDYLHIKRTRYGAVGTVQITPPLSSFGYLYAADQKASYLRGFLRLGMGQISMQKKACFAQNSLQINTLGSHRHQHALNPVINILLSQDTHNFYGIASDAVIDGVYTTYATPVAFADIVGGLIQIGLLGQLIESIKKGVVVLVG